MLRIIQLEKHCSIIISKLDKTMKKSYLYSDSLVLQSGVGARLTEPDSSATTLLNLLTIKLQQL